MVDEPVPAYSAFVPPSIDSSLIGAPASGEPDSDTPDEPVGELADDAADELADEPAESSMDSFGDAGSDVGQDAGPTAGPDDSADEDADVFDESTSSGVDSSTLERIPTFASTPARAQVPAERVQTLDEVPDFDAIMNGDAVIDPRDAQPEDDGVSALAGSVRSVSRLRAYARAVRCL